MDVLRGFVVGKSGSGKTYHAAQIVRAVMPRVDFVVIVNRKRDLEELAAGGSTEYVTREHIDRVTGNVVAAHLRARKRVHYTVTAPDPSPLMEAVGEAALTLGNCLVVVDEGAKLLPHGRTSPTMLEVSTAGRSHNVPSLVLTQSPVSASMNVDKTIQAQANIVCAFRLTRRPEVGWAEDVMPEVGAAVGELARPEWAGDRLTGLPEYAVANTDTGQVGVMRRREGDAMKREYVELAA